VRLELIALSAPAASNSQKPEDVCPQGLALSEGKCVPSTTEAPHRCNALDVADCTAQCDKHDAWSCTAIGNMYWRGVGVTKDLGKAPGYFQRGCDGGDNTGCDWFATTMFAEATARHAELTDPAFVRGAALLQKTCDGGEVEGCALLGGAYEGGRGVAKDVGRALALYVRTCDGGESGICNRLGRMYAHDEQSFQSIVQEDDAKAATYFKRACDGGNDFGCTYLGALYENGKGVAPDRATAVRLYRTACGHGRPRWGDTASGCADLKRLGEALP
jgi:TPR repeat protein